MSLSASPALANALRSTLWLATLYSKTNENGPALHDLKIAIGRAILELEAHATIERSAGKGQPLRANRSSLASLSGRGADSVLAGELAARVLKGERPDDIPVVHVTRTEVQVDWRALRRWHIPELTGSPGEVRLEVTDWGAGFDVDEAKQNRGLGLVSMQERVNLVEGRYSIESNPGKGSRIIAVVPVSNEKLASAEADAVSQGI